MPGGGGGVFSPAHRAITIGILVTITAVAIEGMAVATVMPSVAQDLGGLDAYGWAFSAFMLASLVGTISAGLLSDRTALRVPGLIGFICFSVGLLIASSAPVWLVLLTARAVQGFGAGSLSAISYVVVARAYPESLRPRLMALLSSAWVVPALVGPALAGQVAEHFTWRLVFVGILPPVVIGAGMLLPSLSRLPRANAPSAPPPATDPLSASSTPTSSDPRGASSTPIGSDGLAASPSPTGSDPRGAASSLTGSDGRGASGSPNSDPRGASPGLTGSDRNRASSAPIGTGGRGASPSPTGSDPRGAASSPTGSDGHRASSSANRHRRGASSSPTGSGRLFAACA